MVDHAFISRHRLHLISYTEPSLPNLIAMISFSEEDDSCDGQYGYPAKLLAEMFAKRRDEIDKLHWLVLFDTHSI